MKHSDYITHIKNPEDTIYLNTVLYPVNMRLFKTSPDYKAVVLRCCNYIEFLCRSKMEGYKKPHGMSGANAAIPFNIIAYMKNRGEENEDCVVMINPVIELYDGQFVTTESNCGSLTLPEPIKITRRPKVLVSWFDTDGKYNKQWFSRQDGGFTIQHEVDHNRGILILERQLKT